MSEVYSSRLYAAQIAAQTGSATVKPSSASGGVFAALLKDKLNKSAPEGSAAPSSTQTGASAASSALNYTMMNALSGAPDGSDDTQMLLLILMIMYSKTSANNSGMNALMASMGASGGADPTALNAVTAGAASLSDAVAIAKRSSESEVVQTALTRLGDPYSQAKRGSGDYVDCSYLVKWAYGQVGVTLPSTAAAQAKYCHENGSEISKSELQPGDLVFWSKTSCDCGRWNEIHHVGIYAGDNKVIEARSSSGKVVMSPLWGENGSEWKIAMYARPKTA